MADKINYGISPTLCPMRREIPPIRYVTYPTAR